MLFLQREARFLASLFLRFSSVDSQPICKSLKNPVWRKSSLLMSFPAEMRGWLQRVSMPGQPEQEA